MKREYTSGNVLQNIITFSIPYLISYFLQMLYGLADLYIIGQFQGAASITAVSIGSQLMHMFTVIIVGLAMGSTVLLSQAVGAGYSKQISKIIGNTISLFLMVSLVLSALLLFFTSGVVALVNTPPEAISQTTLYLRICFAGIPFITAYNVISSFFRGMGDSTRPMYFIAIACVLNILLDYIFIGYFHMGAEGAAFATVIAQTCSVLFALFYMKHSQIEQTVTLADLKPDRALLSKLLNIGFPIALQDGLIQVSFMIITVIVNGRGVYAAAGVGIVEKIISVLFLIPSTMMSTVSALAAQNNGAGKHERAKQILWYGISIVICSGVIFTILCQMNPIGIMQLFTKDALVYTVGARYLQSYVFDCIIAGVHFCFSGYFCAYNKSYLSFIHNIISIVVMRIPGAYLFSLWYPNDLFPMGLAAPIGSAISVIICVGMYLHMQRKSDI